MFLEPSRERVSSESALRKELHAVSLWKLFSHTTKQKKPLPVIWQQTPQFLPTSQVTAVKRSV